jgi:hypothetical protein
VYLIHDFIPYFPNNCPTHLLSTVMLLSLFIWQYEILQVIARASGWNIVARFREWCQGV